MLGLNPRNNKKAQKPLKKRLGGRKNRPENRWYLVGIRRLAKRIDPVRFFCGPGQNVRMTRIQRSIKTKYIVCVKHF